MIYSVLRRTEHFNFLIILGSLEVDVRILLI